MNRSIFTLSVHTSSEANWSCLIIDTLRNHQISIFLELFQVANEFMKLIGFGLLMSNRTHEKCGFMKTKRVNPNVGIHPPTLENAYHDDFGPLIVAFCWRYIRFKNTKKAFDTQQVEALIKSMIQLIVAA